MTVKISGGNAMPCDPFNNDKTHILMKTLGMQRWLQLKRANSTFSNLPTAIWNSISAKRVSLSKELWGLLSFRMTFLSSVLFSLENTLKTHLIA